MSPDLLGSLKIPPEIERLAGATFRSLVDGVREGIKAGFLKKDDPEKMALTIWTQCHGLVSLYLSGKLERNPEAVQGNLLGVDGTVVQGACGLIFLADKLTM